MENELTPVEGASPTYDAEGREVIEVATCGVCGRSWNDAAVSSVTPVPSGRCPFEYEHATDDDDAETWARRADSDTLAAALSMPNDCATRRAARAEWNARNDKTTTTERDDNDMSNDDTHPRNATDDDETTTTQPRGAFGLDVGAAYMDQPRSVLGAIETTAAGNVVVRIGREVETRDSWSQTEHVVLTPAEAIEAATELTEACLASLYRNQEGTARYRSAEGILEREGSKLGRAVAALRAVRYARKADLTGPAATRRMS